MNSDPSCLVFLYSLCSSRRTTISTARSYTDDYLDVVNASQVDDYDKLQMCINAVMAYYSGALWVVQ